MMATPLDIQDYAIGFSITERLIESPSDVFGIEIRDAKQGITVELSVKPELIPRLTKQRRQLSGRSGCGVCGISDLASAIPSLEPLSITRAPTHTVIHKAMMTIQEKQALQSQSGGFHCAALFNSDGSLVSIREDIGRHNALDKLIGACIGKIKVDDFICMSSRASHELVVKTAIAGVGSLVTVSAATSLAIDIASQANINLIGFIRGERQIIYHANT